MKRWRATHRPNGEPRPPESLTTEEVDELAALGKQLAERYGWDMQEAQAFVALDYVPPVRLIAGTVTVSSGGQRLPDSHALGGALIPLPWLNRIHLSVDPAVTADQLADHWKVLRRRCVPGTHRPQRQRSLDLVAFIADRAADESPGKVMKAWNAAHPDATYAIVTTSCATHGQPSPSCSTRRWCYRIWASRPIPLRHPAVQRRGGI